MRSYVLTLPVTIRLYSYHMQLLVLYRDFPNVAGMSSNEVKETYLPGLDASIIFQSIFALMCMGLIDGTSYHSKISPQGLQFLHQAKAEE